MTPKRRYCPTCKAPRPVSVVQQAAVDGDDSLIVADIHCTICELVLERQPKEWT